MQNHWSKYKGGEGVKKSKKTVNMVCEWPLIILSFPFGCVNSLAKKSNFDSIFK